MILCAAGYGAVKALSHKSPEDPIFRRGRSGRYEYDFSRDKRPRLWLHAASVGEVTGAIPTLYALKERLPHSSLYLSVGTPAGFRFACAQAPEGIRVLPFPLDFPWVLRRAIDKLQPDLYVSFESEFWPNLFHCLERRRIPALLLNGRLSKRSAERYALMKPLFQPVFRQFRRLAMLSEEDRENALKLGVEPARTTVLGSSKYDGLLVKARPEKEAFWRRMLAIPEGLPVVVGGSLRGSECLALLEVFHELASLEPRLLGVFVPRHLERVPEMARWLAEKKIAFQFLSQIEQGKESRTAPLVLVDRIGILFDLYSLGELIFCGGTLEPIGGHNILEPAAWKKPVFYGPHLQKVLREHKVLQSAGGSFTVQSSKELLDHWKSWLERLQDLHVHGENAMSALRELGGVTAKHVELIVDVLVDAGFYSSEGL